jgi:hypothetical protein
MACNTSPSYHAFGLLWSRSLITHLSRAHLHHTADIPRALTSSMACMMVRIDTGTWPAWNWCASAHTSLQPSMRTRATSSMPSRLGVALLQEQEE